MHLTAEGNTMNLTDEENKMLNGEKGPAAKKAMDILVALGESFGAKRLIPIKSVHMAGAAITVAGDAGTKFVQDVQKQGGEFVTTVTTNPAAVDPYKWKEIGISSNDHKKQSQLTNAYKDMGGNTCNTCTPYLVGNTPRFGEHLAWGESSAVVYANSVLGARTNREGGPSALAASLTGRTPEYGFHLKENRYGEILVKVETPLNNMTDYGTLGYFTGKIVGQSTPVFVGMPEHPSLEEQKALSAALASSGSVTMFHSVGITPEAPTLEEAFGGKEPQKTLIFGDREKGKSEKDLNSEPTNLVDWVQIGCPNATIDEIKEVAKALEERKVHPKVTLWVTTSAPMHVMAEKAGYVKIIEDAGGTMIRETCPFMARTTEFAPTKGYKTLTTNSAKMAYYAPGMFNLPAHYGNLEKIMKATINGVWEG